MTTPNTLAGWIAWARCTGVDCGELYQRGEDIVDLPDEDATSEAAFAGLVKLLERANAIETAARVLLTESEHGDTTTTSEAMGVLELALGYQRGVPPGPAVGESYDPEKAGASGDWVGHPIGPTTRPCAVCGLAEGADVHATLMEAAAKGLDVVDHAFAVHAFRSEADAAAVPLGPCADCGRPKWDDVHGKTKPGADAVGGLSAASHDFRPRA